MQNNKGTLLWFPKLFLFNLWHDFFKGFLPHFFSRVLKISNKYIIRM